MLRIIIFAFIFFSFAQAQVDIPERFVNPKYCVGCHQDQTTDWLTTWHSKSHYDSNPLYSAVVDYMSRVSYQQKETILVDCAQCHNPRMVIKSIDDTAFEYGKILGIETESIKNIDKRIDDPNLKNGISCYICHNVDKVHQSTDLKMRGFNAVTWTKAGTIVGPFEDDGRADGFHRSSQREHFVDSNQLCMVCHFGGQNKFGTKIYATGEEAAASKDKTKCADCHMSTHKKAIISPQIVKAGVTPQMRDIRSHLFAGARNSDIMKTTFKFDSKVDKNNLILTVENLTPHKAPTGYGDRSIKIKVEFKNGSQLVGENNYFLESVFVDKNGVETIPYLARSIKSDTRLNADETRSLKIDRPLGATTAEVTVTYRLVRGNIIEMLKLENDTTFNKEYAITAFTVKL